VLRVAIHVAFASTVELVRACHAGVSLVSLRQVLAEAGSTAFRWTHASWDNAGGGVPCLPRP